MHNKNGAFAVIAVQTGFLFWLCYGSTILHCVYIAIFFKLFCQFLGVSVLEAVKLMPLCALVIVGSVVFHAVDFVC